jgi:hypothetical protein
MTIPFTGGCACGAIRYECSAEPIMMFKCHCRDCQQVTGGGFVAGLLVPGVGISSDEGATALPFHTARGGRYTQAPRKERRGQVKYQSSRASGAYSLWRFVMGKIAAANNKDGRLELFGIRPRNFKWSEACSASNCIES